jgi:2-polyprenyl-3-methyl-5-hydroxy-6-metoxy-1,4-benzoquinol methylase
VLARKPRRPSGPSLSLPFRCLLCEGESARELFGEAVPESLGYHVARCDRCGLVVTVPRPAFEAIPAFYGQEYYGVDNNKFGPLTEIFIFLFRVARLRAVRRMGVTRGAILDLGCGRGLFLRVMKRFGYHVWGTELDETAARAAQQRSGGEVRVGPLIGCRFDAGQFDAVTAWQVFEHFHDPDVVLRECHRILRPGGVLIMSMPNIDSWQARWAGASWFHLDLPRHLFHYDPTTITRMLAARGFRVEKISQYSMEQDPFGLLQSALHRLGGSHFGLYRLLRGPVDRQERDRLRRLPLLAAYLVAFVPAATISTLWSLWGSGAAFTVLARRMD